MDLTIAMEYRFDRTPDGAIWTETSYPLAYWDRYLKVFDSVIVLARARDVPIAQPQWMRVDGDRVRCHAIPHYVGPMQYLLNQIPIRRAIRAALAQPSAVILRVPGAIGALAATELRRKQRPYGLEVVGDPWDVFAPGANVHPLRPFFRLWSRRQLRNECLAASHVLYVTEWTLQRRYPRSLSQACANYHENGAAAFGVSDVEMSNDAFAASDVDLGESAYADRALSGTSPAHRLRLLTVGSMDQPYKGYHTLIDAVALCVRQGLELELHMVGGGRMRDSLESRTRQRGVNDRILFVGPLPAGSAVRKELDGADLFVQPSLVEGMPRALIEAMARCMPCIGSRIGGIPEVLTEEALVSPGDVRDLANRITVFARDPGLRARLARYNREVALRFHVRNLQPKREAFYGAVRAAARRAETRPGGAIGGEP